MERPDLVTTHREIAVGLLGHDRFLRRLLQVAQEHDDPQVRFDPPREDFPRSLAFIAKVHGEAVVQTILATEA